VAAAVGDGVGSAWVSVRGTIRTGRVAICSSRLATLPSGTRGRSVRDLVVHDRDIERIQGRRDQGAYHQALAWLRIGEPVQGWRGTGSANDRCSHLFLVWIIR
jgi:hypothetical protein